MSGTSPYRSLPRRTMWSRFVGLGAALFGCGLTIAVFVARNKQSMNANDLGVNTRIHDFGLDHPFLREIVRVVSWLGSGSHTVPIVLTFLLALLVFRKWRWLVVDDPRLASDLGWGSQRAESADPRPALGD